MPTARVLAVAFATVAFASPPAAHADGLATTIRADRPQPPPRRYADLRVGASTSATRAVLCGYAAPLARLGVEACGTGAGFLHDDPSPEVAHFRALWRVHSWDSPAGWVQARLAFGFAEVQAVALDRPGFWFLGPDPDRVETAGPEAGVSVQLFEPVYGGLQFVADLGLALAWFPHARALRPPQDTWLAEVTLTLGAGL